MSILRVAFDLPLPRLFDYSCDDATAADIGMRVLRLLRGRDAGFFKLAEHQLERLVAVVAGARRIFCGAAPRGQQKVRHRLGCNQ